jgi:hypothetical protein
MHGLYQRRLVRHSGGPAAMSRVVHGLERPRLVSGFRPVTLRPNLSIGLPLSKLKLSHGKARPMPLFKTKSIEFWVIPG